MAINRINPKGEAKLFSLIVGDGNDNIDSSAALEAKSTAQGVLIPRMTTAERDSITSPGLSLLIFNTDVPEFEYWDSSAWVGLAGTFNGSITYPNEVQLSFNTQQDNLVVSSGTNTVFLTDSPNSGSFTLTGIVNNGINEQITIVNNKASNVTIQHNSGSSSAGNRFDAGGASTILSPDDAITIRWSAISNAWKLISSYT